MKEFYISTAWNAQFGRRDVVVYDYVPVNSDIRIVGPILARDKPHAERKFKRFIKTGSAE